MVVRLVPAARAMMPPDGLAQLADSDAIYLGAVGLPGAVPDHVSLWGLLLPIRQGFDQYINLRPCAVLRASRHPCATVARPTSTSSASARTPRASTAASAAASIAARPKKSRCRHRSITRRGVERVVRFAFERAMERRRRLASATKSNALQYTAVLWDEVVDEVARDFPDVEVTPYHVDALAARFVTAPDSLDVVVGSNLYGDILTDLGGALQGSLGSTGVGQHRPVAPPPVDVRARPRVGAQRSPARASPTRWRRSGRPRSCWTTWARPKAPGS